MVTSVQPGQTPATTKMSTDGDFNGQWCSVRHQHHMDLSPHSSMATVTWSGGGVPTHAHHVHTSLASLQSSSCLVDVSLISGSGDSVMGHKIVLASASPLLRQLFTDNDKKVNRKIMSCA